MGLLDSLSDFASSDQGLGLAQGLLSARGSQGLSAGLAGMQRAKQLEQEMAMKKQFQAMQMEEMQAQAMQRKALAQREQEMLLAAQRKQAALPSLFGQGAGSGPTDQVNAALPSDLRIGAQPALPGAGGLDWKRGLAAGYTPKELQDMAGLRNINQEKVARTIDGKDAQGRPVTYQLDEFGRPVSGSPIEQWKAPITMERGDRTTFVDPVTQKEGASFARFQSPESKASNAVAWANHNLSNQRFQYDRAQGEKPQWIESLGGFANPRTQQVMPARDMQGNQIEGAGPKMTEDQAKASGWLVQADNAFKNMKAATAKDPSAARPGFNDALAAIPSMGLTTGAANLMRGAERQQYMQGASSLSEALLRAATGAGVNKDEALQKVRELTPQIGDDPATIAQKEAAIPLYIESLKLRAGPGAKRAAAVMSGGSSNGSSGGWSIQKVN